MRRPRPADARQSFAAAPRRRLAAEVYCLALVFLFHGRNNHLRKAVTLMVVAVWAVLEIIAAIDSIAVTLPEQFWWLRLFVGLLLGRLWDIEFTNFARLGSGPDHDDGENK